MAVPRRRPFQAQRGAGWLWRLVARRPNPPGLRKRATPNDLGSQAQAKDHDGAVAEARANASADSRLSAIGQQAPGQVLAELGSTGAGLDPQEAERRRRLYGANEIPRQKNPGWPQQLLASVSNPLVVLLTALGACRTLRCYQEAVTELL